MELTEFVRVCAPLLWTHNALSFVHEGSAMTKLPPDTSKIVFHPDSRVIRNWGKLVAIIRL
eukprot:scaffold681391_cov81-Prasinocladus_malaysianus.AAC.1